MPTRPVPKFDEKDGKGGGKGGEMGRKGVVLTPNAASQSNASKAASTARLPEAGFAGSRVVFANASRAEENTCLLYTSPSPRDS